MRHRIPSLLLLMLLAAALCACGSKGALVMPDQQATSKNKHAPKPTLAPTAPASSDDSGKPR